MSEDETVGWHHRCNGHELGQTSDVEGQGGLACCSPWGCKELDMTGQLNNNLLFLLLANYWAVEVLVGKLIPGSSPKDELIIWAVTSSVMVSCVHVC